MATTVTSVPSRLAGQLAAPVAVGCCLAAGAAYVAARDPSDGGVFLPCPFRVVTGWWCPGCGLTRATHHLAHGDLTQALRFNALAIVILGALAAGWTIWLLASAGRAVGWVARIPVWSQVAAGAVLVAFGVVRNLPGAGGLRG